jgi:formylglycine-generating enzyme required for sulfatase activity
MTAISDSDCERCIIPLAKGVTMAFRRIPACPEGFLMGSRGYRSNEEPIHRVVIGEDFWMGETPVTQAQFGDWTRATRIKHKNFFNGKPKHPAENMTWQQAHEYCGWLTAQQGSQLPTEHRFASLPTEAHWEYACRGGTHTEYHTGDGVVALRQAGWFGEDFDMGSTHPVGELAANAFGLHDLHGNVWEWCLDRWDDEAYRRRWDGIEAMEAFAMNEQFGDQSEYNPRVVRGGSWGYSAVGCRAAFRGWYRAGCSVRFIGFRVCLVRSPISGQNSMVAPP